MSAVKLPAIHLRHATRDSYLPVSAAAEFFGVLLLQLLAGSAGDGALETAFVFSSLLYVHKYISGGHLNPGVSFAGLLSGHIDWVRGCTYICAQVAGALMGALMQAWLSPFSKVGEPNMSCHEPMRDLGNGRTFMWETLMTFLFLAVFYTSIFVRPGHGDVASLAPGLALFAALSTGGAYTGGSPLDPARAFATACVFKCSWRWAGVFIASHITAACLAAGWALVTFGKGDFFKKVDPTSQLRESLVRGGAEPLGEAGLSTQQYTAPTQYAGNEGPVVV